ncbi:hypothetical protein B0H94_104166 [Salsuginibacillus halophilus]|uniref:UPF0178 protein B0H94_104166 n=1 Tax=Salsuginibacillus halophilus TaxID=517424 RepID=A0A2P8HQS4_9BACI|nr:YaiI/YqxD family protein [Salsuginibacillus halophilus]PSL48565.1 hypothetical protein B0H94_104166 [Salsuginibacillus halophilus]
MIVYVDGDACPVKTEVTEEALAAGAEVVFVQSYAHFSGADAPAGVAHVYVDTGREAADYKLMQLAGKGDIMVTQDYGLASLALGKGCRVIHPTGFVYTPETIDAMLEARHASAAARRSGQKTKGPKAFTDAEREAFRSAVRDLLNK